MSSFMPRLVGVFAAGLLVAVASCKESLGPDTQVTSLEVVPDGARLYLIGQEIQFEAVVTTAAGVSGEGIDVSWVTRDPSLVQIGANGLAKMLKKGGATYVVATAGGKSDSALVEALVSPCGNVAPTVLVPGQVVADIGAAGICTAAAAGDYTVVVHNTALLASGITSIDISAIGVDNPPITSGISLSRMPALALGTDTRFRRDVMAEMRHRRNEEAALAPLAASMRAWYDSRSRRATQSVQPQAVGDVMTLNLNINGNNGCTDPRIPIAVRVAAVSNSAIVLADPRNPEPGFTDAEYAEFAATFDAVINPLDVTNFGAPTDLDNNQRVLLVFTRAVNERTAKSADSYVGGITHSRDLAPRASCAGSNEAEMFYLIVPDSLGTVNGNLRFTKTFVKSVTDATVAHEYQHIINFGRRRYLNPGAPLASEELWLNEGLSHMAEELLYHQRSGYPTRANLGQAEVDANFRAFADYMGGNFLNYDDYAASTPTSSPFQSSDDLPTRGATWAFLRYAADRRFSADGQLWYNLVNNGETGVTNLQNRLGLNAAGLAAMLRDFHVSVYADDFVAGIAPQYTQLSWNMRSIYPVLDGYPAFNFPLASSPLNDMVTRPAFIAAGGFKTYRYSGRPNVDSFIRVTGASGSALPPSVTMTVIRTR